MTPSINIGITLSQTHLARMGISVMEALDCAIGMRYSHIRLGSYWSEVERNKGVYDFSFLDEILGKCMDANQPIILTLGIKSPRWPEFYYPRYIADRKISNEETQERGLMFMERTLNRYRQHDCITHWQVENEPLDPSGPNNETIPIALLEEEVNLVRKLDRRQIILTLWANDMRSRNLLDKIIPLADIVGLDLYFKQYVRSVFGKDIYLGPRVSDGYLKSIIKDSPKRIMITELQGEPWEKNHATYLSTHPESISIPLLRRNIAKAKELGVSEILLWGFEYWYYRMKRGDTSYIDLISEYIN